MNCLYLKLKLNKTIYCKKMKQQIKLSDCSNCNFKTFKSCESSNTLKNATFRRTKLQKNRFSIINRSLDKCAVCSLKTDIQLNEVFEGAKRNVSMKNGFVVPLCDKHHKLFHNNREFALKFKKEYQRKFEETHSREEFLNLIHRNYL